MAKIGAHSTVSLAHLLTALNNRRRSLGVRIIPRMHPSCSSLLTYRSCSTAVGTIGPANLGRRLARSRRTLPVSKPPSGSWHTGNNTWFCPNHPEKPIYRGIHQI